MRARCAASRPARHHGRDHGQRDPSHQHQPRAGRPSLDSEPLRPGAASWTIRGGSHLAVLRYDDARAQPDPRAAVADFYESAYRAGARRAGWDTDRYACPGGVTSAPPATEG